jgi:hypothetical protein
MCCWPLPAKSFSGPGPLGLVTVFYCLRIETSLFSASYDSQGHGGGIRPRLHTGFCVWLQALVIFSRARTAQKTPLPSLRVLSLLGKRVHRCSLATAVVLSFVYTAVAWQWVYMSHKYSNCMMTQRSTSLTGDSVHTFP